MKDFFKKIFKRQEEEPVYEEKVWYQTLDHRGSWRDMNRSTRPRRQGIYRKITEFNGRRSIEGFSIE